MPSLPSELQQKLSQFKQEHLLLGFDSLSHIDQQSLIDQLQAVDFARLQSLFQEKDAPVESLSEDRIRPIPTEHVNSISEQAIQLGRESLSRGEVGVILVAGGQGSRLGFEKPKGMFPIGPVTQKTLFQIHAEKVLALRRKYGQPVPFLIMTSPATHQETVANFEENRYFGLPAKEVFFFQQGTMPALDLATGKLLLEKKGQLFTSPNGHGGTLTALSDSGLLDQLKARGIRHLFYFQVDNPLVTVCDPRFLGRHIETGSQASSKAIAKAFPDEKMGVFALLDGKCSIIEYSDMPKELKHATAARGELLHRAGSPAIHLFEVDFLQNLLQKGAGLPFHLARKKVPCLDESGNPISPKSENALKFEMFIFDALPLATRWLVIESPRGEEFAPVKNAEGVDSPQTCKQALCELYASWLEAHGASVSRGSDGKVNVPIEISPLFALSAEDLHGRIVAGTHVNSPIYWE
jgi:UDP-N-acetylglucosamine/UDP-N-acetylgalactosamine diphosphorylase